MLFELDRLGLSWMAGFARRRAIWFLLGAIVGCAVFLRCLHLLNPDHYFILSPDSYVFHWLAGRVMAGEGPPPGASTDIYVLHSGLAYPMAYIAEATGFVFSLSPADALDVVSKFLPPLLAVISMVVMYLAVAKICDRRAALFSAVAWALMLHLLFIGAAGHVDRDGLSMLLIMTAAFLFYLSRGWHLKVGGRDIGWLVAGLGVLGLEVLVVLEWTFSGALLLLAVLLAYFVVRFLVGYFDRMKTEPSTVRRLISAISEVNWQVFAVIIGGNIIVLIALVALYYDDVAHAWEITVWAFTGEKRGIAEMQYLSTADFIAYHLLIIPMAFGLYLAWKKRGEGSIFFACWFLVLLALGLFARRIVIYAEPAACGLAGIGLAFLWDWQSRRRFRFQSPTAASVFAGIGLAFLWDWQSRRRFRFQSLNKVGITVLLCLAMLFSAREAYYMGSHPGVAPSNDWQDALAYISEETPQDAVIMSWWEQGKWVLDLGERRPVADCGVYGCEYALKDIGVAYATSDPAQAVQIMGKYAADYLVLSTRELELAPAILEWAELDEEHDSFPEDSLIVRSLNGGFDSEGGLEVVYRSAPGSEVIILGLTPP